MKLGPHLRDKVFGANARLAYLLSPSHVGEDGA
jgi:hypothetical protein